MEVRRTTAEQVNTPRPVEPIPPEPDRRQAEPVEIPWSGDAMEGTYLCGHRAIMTPPYGIHPSIIFTCLLPLGHAYDHAGQGRTWGDRTWDAG